MNNKTMISILIFSFLTSMVWLGFNTSNSSDQTVKQEMDMLKAELKELRMMLAKNAHEEGTSNPINQDLDQKNFPKQHLSEQQQIALLTKLLQTSVQETNNDSEIEVIETPEAAAQREKIALEKEAQQIKETVNYLNTELEQEEVDATWSSTIEQNLWDKFEEKELQGSTLVASDCRTTFCRITIKNNSDTHFSPGHIMVDIFSNSEGFFNSTVDSNGMTTTELYVSRSNHNLPTNPIAEN